MNNPPDGKNHRKPFWRSIQGQLILVLLVSLLPTLLVQAFVFNRWYETRRNDELYANLQIARAVAKNFEEFVSNVVQQEYAIGHVLASFSLSQEERRLWIEGNKALYPEFLNLLWVSPEGTILISHLSQLEGKTIADRKYFQEIVSGRGWSVSDLQHAKATGEPVIAIASGIRKNGGQLLGIVVASIPSDRFNELLKIERPSGGGHAIVDSQGMLVFRYPWINPTWEERRWIKDYPEFGEAIAGKEISKTVFAPYEGKNRLVSFVPVQALGWAASAGRTEDIALEGVVSELMPQAALLFVITLSAFATALFCSRFMVASVKRLRNNAIALGAGDTREPAVISGPTEIRELAESFNEMAENLKSREIILRDQREWLRVTLNSIGDAVLTTDRAGNVTFLNPVAVAMTGWTPEEAAGEPVHNVFRIIDERTGEPAEGVVERVLRDGNIVQLANHTVLISRDGREIPVEDSAAPIKDEGGNIIGVVLVFHDVTQRRRAQVALRESEERFRVAQELSPDGFSILRPVRDQQGQIADFTWLYANAATSRLVGHPPASLLDRSLLELCPGHRDSAFIRTYRQVAESGQPCIQEALYHGDGILDQRWFRVVVVSMGRDIAVLSQDITDRKKSDQALREAEQRYRGVVQNTTAVILRLDLQGIIRFANERALNFFGYSEDELIGSNAIGTIVPEQETTGRDLAAMVREIAKDPDRFHFNANENIRKNGERVWMEWTNSGVYDSDGTLKEFLSVGIDATDRKRAEEALVASEKRFRILYESMRDPFVHVSMDGRVVEFNDLYRQMLGYAPEEMRALTYQEMTPECWHEYEERIVREQIIARGYSDVYEKEYRRKDGTIFPVELRTILSKDDSGQPNGMWGIVRDISERKKVEASLRESEQQFKDLFNFSPEPLSLASLDESRILEANQAYCELIGYAREEIIARTSAELGIWLDSGERELARKILSSEGSVHDFEFRLKTKSGNVKTVLLNIDILDVKGSPHMLFAIRDITDRKRAEEAVRQSEARFRSLFENMAEGVALHEVVYDERGAAVDYKILTANPGFEKHTGISVDECRGQLASVFYGTGSAPFLEIYSGTADSGESTSFVTYFAPMDRHFDISVSSPKKGQFVTVFEDITERKRTEIALEETRKRLSLIVDSIADGFYALDDQLRFTHINDAALGYFGKTRAEVIGKTLPELFPKVRGTVFETRYHRAMETGNPEHFEAQSVATDRIVEMHAYPAPDNLTVLFRDVTERKLLETGIREIADKYSTLFNNTSDGIWIQTLEGNILEVNDAYCQMVGYTREELLGIPISRLEAVESPEEITHHIQRIQSDGHDRFESQHRRKDGSVFDLDITVLYFPMYGGRIATFARDITARKKMEAELRRSESEFKLLSDTADALLRTENPQGIVDELCRKVMVRLDCHVFFNFLTDDGAGKLHLNACGGIPEEEARKIDWLEFGAAVCGCVARDGNRIVAEDIFNTPDARTDLVKSYGIQAYACHPLNIGDRLIGTLSFGTKSRPRFSARELAVMKTVADQVAIAMERVRLIEGLRGARDELELRVQERTAELQRSNQALQEFASIASHDLQEPLRKVQSFGNMLKRGYEGSLDDRGKDYLNRVLGATGRMQSLIQALLEYSRVSTRGEEHRLVDFSEIVGEVLSDLEVRIDGSGAKIEVDELPSLDADPIQMRQLFQNLIGNALKFQRPGERPVIRIYFEQSDGGVRVFLQDNGIGFEEKYLERILAPFQRLHGRGEYEGTGMGLAICKKIVERHGGRITARSAPGKGSTFIIQFPYRKVQIAKPV